MIKERGNNMDSRLKEICKKVLEINKDSKEYVAIFMDGRGGDPFYFIFKDGDGQNELYDLSPEDVLLCSDNNIIDEDSYKGYHNRAIYKFKINEIQKLLNIEEVG